MCVSKFVHCGYSYLTGDCGDRCCATLNPVDPWSVPFLHFCINERLASLQIETRFCFKSHHPARIPCFSLAARVPGILLSLQVSRTLYFYVSGQALFCSFYFIFIFIHVFIFVLYSYFYGQAFSLLSFVCDLRLYRFSACCCGSSAVSAVLGYIHAIFFLFHDQWPLSAVSHKPLFYICVSFISRGWFE